MKKMILSVVLLMSSSAWSYTYVGNGGNAGDIELQVALNQVQDTLKSIIKDKEDPELKLCTCYQKYEGRPVCNILKQLTPPQVSYCAAFIRDKAPELVQLIAHRDRIHFSWTHAAIEVNDGGQLRGADAVTDPAQNKMTINQESFLDMSPGQRAFLLGHELFHLVKQDEALLKDEGEVGPFQGADGGRQFINSMAASLVMESYDYGSLNKYNNVLERSQGSKRFWAYAGVGTLNIPGDSSSTYAIHSTGGGQLGLRYHWNEWGVLAEYSSYAAKKDILTTIKAEEKRQVWAVGIAYRWFPFEDPMTFLGQSHFVWTAKIESLTAQYKLEDPSTGISDSASSNAWSVGGNYFMPLRYDLWVYLGVGYSAHHYGFEKLNALGAKANYSSNNSLFNLGVSYAF